MEGISYIKVFNKLIDEFLNELMDIFPNETKIKVQHNLFQTLCKSNSRKIPNDFMIKLQKRMSIYNNSFQIDDDEQIFLLEKILQGKSFKNLLKCFNKVNNFHFKSFIIKKFNRLRKQIKLSILKMMLIWIKSLKFKNRQIKH